MGSLGVVPNFGQIYNPDSFTGNGSTTTFTLSHLVTSDQSIIWIESGVTQKPGVDYTIAGLILTRTTAPANGVACFAMYLGVSVDVGTIGGGAVTLAKMAVNSIDSDQYIDGSIDEAHIANDAVNFATHLKAGTDGELITWDASGNPAAVAVGTSGQVLTSAGAGAPPTFAAAGSSTTFAQAPVILHQSGGGGSLTDSPSAVNRYNGLTVDITPTSASNKILIYFQQQQRIHSSGGGVAGYDAIHNQLQRGNSSTTIGSVAALISGFGGTVTQIWNQNYLLWTQTTTQIETHLISYLYLDSPSTTSLCRYFSSISNSGKGEHIQWKVDTGTAQMYAMEIQL